jgi:hypothetical protein
MVPVPPSPARNALHVAEATAQALQYYSRRFGPFPYSHLALTQMPGPESQGWPGLVFLSSYAFLSEQERADLHMDFSRSILAQQDSTPMVGRSGHLEELSRSVDLRGLG